MIRLSLKVALLVAGATAGLYVPASAETFRKERLDEYAKLPDWSGTWRLKGSEILIEHPSSTEEDYNKGLRDRPPYNAEWQAKYERHLQDELKQGDAKADDQLIDTFTLYCLTGMPRFMATPFQYQFVNAPGVSWIIAGGEVRQIYTDGRKRPDDDIIWPKFYGWSSGQWRGQDLFVETTDLMPGLWADTTPVTFSPQVKVNERIFMVDANTIQVDIEIVDPISLTRPWKISRQYLRAKEDWIDEREVCTGPNERHPIIDGKVTTKLK